MYDFSTTGHIANPQAVFLFRHITI